jgi:hypothetical protein
MMSRTRDPNSTLVRSLCYMLAFGFLILKLKQSFGLRNGLLHIAEIFQFSIVVPRWHQHTRYN